MDEKNFKISGIPDNNEIELPDEQTKKKRTSGPKMISLSDMKNFSAEDIEDIINQFPPELKKFMESSGLDANHIMDQMNVMLGNISEEQFSQMLQGFDIDGCDSDCDCCDEEEMNPKNIFPTGESVFLYSDEFGSLECYSSENLYDEFVERYGTDSTLYLDDNIGIRDFLLNDLTSHINFDEIKNMRFINSNEHFILFYMEPEDSNKYGFYAAIVKRGEGNFALYVPTYCNTFDIVFNEEGSPVDITLFDKTEDSIMFAGSSNDITAFKFLSANLIEFAVQYVLAPKNNVLLAPADFGEIKNIRPPISADSSTLPIGRISSNGSANSTLLLKDAELPLDSDSYNLFIKFPRVVDINFLKFISELLFKVDFNNSPLLKNVELKYTSDGKLYFEINHFGDF